MREMEVWEGGRRSGCGIAAELHHCITESEKGAKAKKRSKSKKWG